MKIKKKDVSEIIKSNLMLLSSKERLNQYLINLPSKNYSKEIHNFWKEDIYLKDDFIFKALFNEQEKKLIETIDTLISNYTKKSQKNLQLILNSEEWLLIKKNILLLLKQIKSQD